MSNLQETLEKLPLDLLERINSYGGLQVVDLLDLIKSPRSFSVYRPEDVSKVSSLERIHADEGISLMSTCSVVCCVLADERSLRRIRGTDRTLLELKLTQLSQSSFRNVWIMVPPVMIDDVRSLVRRYESLTGSTVFSQYETFLFTAVNSLYLQDSKPLLRVTGSGDLIPAIKSNGMLQDFIKSGGRHVVVVDANNIAAFDPGLLGYHASSSSYVTSEVTRRIEGESGNVLCHHDGVTQLVEDYRLEHAYVDEFTFRSTGVLVFEAELPFENHRDMWHRVKRNVNGELLVQHERLLNDITSTFRTTFVYVDRHDRLIKIDDSELCA